MAAATDWPTFRHAGAPSSQTWKVAVRDAARIVAHGEMCGGWELWADVRPPFRRPFFLRLPGTWSHGETPAHPAVSEWVPVPVAALARAFDYIAPAIGRDSHGEPAYRRVHVGFGGELGATNGHRAHHSGPVLPVGGPVPAMSQAAAGALDHAIRAARTCGAPVIGAGVDPAGRLVLRVVTEAADVWLATDAPDRLIPQLWQTIGDERAASSGLCAELHADGPAVLAALVAAVENADPSGEGKADDPLIRLRADAAGVWITGGDFDAGDSAVRLPGRYVMQTERVTERAICATVDRSQLLRALAVPLTPAALVIRDEWTPLRVDAAGGFGALVMPLRPARYGVHVSDSL